LVLGTKMLQDVVQEKFCGPFGVGRCCSGCLPLSK
jgi:hypothetical protein